MLGVAGGTVAGMGAGVGETEQNRNFRFPNMELLVSKPGTPGFWGKTDSILERPKLKFLHSNLKFGQNKSCRGKKDLQHWYWIKVVLINDLRDKIGSKEDQS